MDTPKDLSTSNLLILDAHAAAYRAYYALAGAGLFDAESGSPTNAIYGFFRMFFKLMVDQKPDFCVVVWDPPGPNFRNRLYDQYKANRKPMPDDLRSQIEEMKDLLARSGFQNICILDVEADDVIGALSKKFNLASVTLVTADKDCYQLLDKKVSMLKNRKGVSEFTRIDPEWVRLNLGIEISQVVDYMGLVGDTSDNIPGASGIGPKTASKLLKDFQSLSRIYENLSSIHPPSLREKLISSHDNVFLSQQLATLSPERVEEDIPNLESLKTPSFLNDSVLQLFRHRGFNQIYKDLEKLMEKNTRERNAREKNAREKDPKENPKEVQNENKAWGEQITLFQEDKQSSFHPEDSNRIYELIVSVEGLKQALDSIQKDAGKYGFIALDTETDSLNTFQAQLVGVSLCAKKGSAYYISLFCNESFFSAENLPVDEMKELLKEFLEDPKLKIVGQNLKYDYKILQNHGIYPPEPSFDTMIASYLCSPGIRRHNLTDLSLDHLGLKTISYESVVGKGRKQKTMAEIPPEGIREYACEDADMAFQLSLILKEKLKENGLAEVYSQIELPLLPVLIRMEKEGVGIDTAWFEKLSFEYARKLADLEQKIFHYAGTQFNIHSTKELQKILFEDLNLPKGRKTKTGYSTDQSVLESMVGLHPLIDLLLDHRKYGRLKSAYVDSLPALLHTKTNRIHTNFAQAITATGRLSSADPNLQNIPIRDEEGRNIRRGFIPHLGNLLISMDYSQIELRIMAHCSQDSSLIQAFTKDDIDVHKQTASSLFGVSESELNSDMRAQAKTVNFAIIYGVTEFGLSRSLDVDMATAKEYIRAFFAKYKGVKSYMDSSIAYAKEHGYVKTLCGRIRHIPDIQSSNHFRREAAQRTAINTPIQGSSADIIKIAMIKIDKEIQKRGLKSKMILQVHDELLFDVHPDEEEELSNLAQKSMEGAIELSVPLPVEKGKGANWDEAH